MARRKVLRSIVCGVVVLFASAASAAAPEASGPATLRIRFGYKDTEPTDWSGSIATPAPGKVESICGWRWAAGDKAEGNTWTVGTRRPPAQTAAQRQRARAGQNLPMVDNGVIVTLSGVKPEDEIKFEAKPGSFAFKLADLPYGQKKLELSGNVAIERVAAARDVADSAEDEDYPAAAMGKDGTLYVAYLSFKHGKDFEGPDRERPASRESGPNGGPLAVGSVRKIEKPEDLDYLAEPTGGEQVYLRMRKPGGAWSEPTAVTDGKLELYRPTMAIDGAGKVWVFYSAQLDADKNLDHGNWEVMARAFTADGKPAGEPINISSAAGTDFMPAATTDASGKVWITWVGARKDRFNIYVASQDGEKFTAPQRVTNVEGNEWEPAIAADAKGNIAIAWDTYAKGDYDVYLARRGADGKFESAQPVAATLAFDVRPSIVYDGEGRLWIAWEESGDRWGKDFGALKKQGIPIYQAGRSIATKVLSAEGHWMQPPDVMDAVPAASPTTSGHRPRGAGTAGKPQPAGVSGSIAPCYPRLATDGAGNVFLAFRGKPGANWRVAVGSVWFEYVTMLDGDKWDEAVWVPRSSGLLDNRPAIVAHDGALEMLYSGDGRGEMNSPKADAAAGAAPGAAPIDALAEAAAQIPVPGSSDDDVANVPTRADIEAQKAVAVAAADAQAADDPKPRRGGGGGRRAARTRGEVNADLFATTILASDFPAGRRAGAVIAVRTVEAAQPAAVPTAEYVLAERKAVQAIRDYRITVNGQTLRIWRGEFHRHTELSMDGGGDGGLLDLWRYAIDAADLDWIGDGDHDYGAGREYSWWTTQKCVTLFTVPNRFVPVFCYERSVSYPEGHRNCMFATRGVRSLPRLPISDPQKFAPAPDTNLLYLYLKRFGGLCAPHTSATDMGTDWRNYDAEVEPFVEIYQGDRNNYERPDAPRTAVTQAKLKQSTPEKESLGGWRPKGFVNLALKMGRRYAFEASSDHISTHLAYCNVLIPADVEPTRQAVLDAIKKRRVYGSTDNLIADIHCTDAGGKDHIVGEEFSTTEAPTLKIHLAGPQKFVKVTIIKDDEEVHVIEPGKETVDVTWTDPKPTNGQTSYYYVRGEQAPDMEGISSGEIVWASPMWIGYEGR
jgi:hypothetical protein